MLQSAVILLYIKRGGLILIGLTSPNHNLHVSYAKTHPKTGIESHRFGLQ